MSDPDPLEDLLGASPAFEEVKARARQLLSRARAGARLPPVLIQGETGSGKGLLARALHRAGPRARGPFVAVNCGAIPETLGESELFGFARGAHSEARRSKIGYFPAADRGVIFLDEVGLLSEGHQARLLKIVEDRHVIPVGSTTPVPIDVWVISATNADLSADVAAQRFRRDLYERLAVVTFTLPPLRARPGDVGTLAQQFLSRTCSDYGMRLKKLAPDAHRRLADHAWPGNVRELANVIERAALLVDGDTISADRLELGPAPSTPHPGSSSAARATHATGTTASAGTRRDRVAQALARHDGNITRAALDLGVTRKTLRDWMRQDGLYPDREARDPPSSAPNAPDETRLLAGPEAAIAVGVRIESSPALAEPPLEQQPNILWERRWIALLRLSLSVDNDGLGIDTARPLEVAAQKIQAFGGQVIELSQHGLDAAFGLEPLDDAPHRAAYAALAIQRAGARAREESRPIPVSRVALHADSYLVGRLGISARISQDAKHMADARLAALIGTAPPEAAMVSPTMLQLLRRRFEFAGPIETPDAGGVHRLLGRADRPALFDRQISFFVGRDSEITLLHNRWDLARRGHGQIVGIVGEPGVGKSRLVWEFLHAARSGPGLVLETASVALGRPTPYAAIIDLLRAYFAIDAGESDALIRDTVARRLADVDRALVPVLPAFLSLFDVPTGDGAWEALDPVRRRKQTFDAIKHLMLRESVRTPLLLVFEDAHWADTETRALLDMVADSLPVARVLIVVTFRPEYEHGWGRRSFYTQVRVDPLDGDGLQRFLSDLLGDHPSLVALRSKLSEWTEGNPFFLEEAVSTLAEAGALEGKRGAYAMTRPTASVTVPETVHQVLAARMARLEARPHELLRIAAVVGRRVPYVVLASMSGQSDADVDRDLDVLRAREFLTENVFAEEREYAFRHALTQDVAYATLPEDQRRSLHARTLAALEHCYAARLDDKLAELSHHAFEGRQWDRAAVYLRRAGARAFARSANTEAAACYEQALTALTHLPQSRETIEAAIDLRFELRNALTPLAQAHRALEHLREAERLSGVIGDDRRQARALSFAANSLCLVADYRAALDAGQRAREHATSLGDFPLRVASGMYVGRALAGLGEYRRAADVLREVATSLEGERARDFLGLPVLPAVFSRSHLVLSLAELGEFDEAERFAGAAIAIAEDLRQPDTLLWAHVSAGVARLVRGEVAGATLELERALELCRTADMPVYVPLVGSPLGLAYVMGGREDEGLALVAEAVERAETRKQVALLAWTWLRLGEAHLLAGHLEKSRDAVAKALVAFREHGERGGEAYALRASAEIAARDGDGDGAESLFADVEREATRAGMAPLSARCRLALGLSLDARGRRPEARAHLVAAATAFERMGVGRWAREARAALEALGP